ncbi:FAD-binding domain protein [Ceratobasidium sp. AG-Ba]|nr:FAD-binding domain protein [Ceratobasidium sp. AG-Ba]
MTPRIAIIGAGPGGLTLASLLQRSSIQPFIYERDPFAGYRPQGGTLDLHYHSGQQALRDAGLWDEFLKHARFEAQAMKILTKSLDLVFEDEPPSEDQVEDSRPEIDRTALRAILLQAVGNDKVNWGHALASVEPATDHTFNLHFKDGKTETGFDLVVGADGAWSHVRPLITSVTPFYSGISVIELRITSPQGAKFDAVNELVGQGNAFTFGDGKAIQAQRLGTGDIRIYASFTTGEDESDWLKRFDPNNPSAVKAEILTYFDDWAPVLQDIIRLSDDTVQMRPLYMAPLDYSWTNRQGLTLLGDAAHVMTPYAGEGVNAAMWDSLELAKAIIEGVKTGNLNEHIQQYEKEMFERAHESARRTNRNKESLFAKNFPDSVAEVMEEIQQGSGNAAGPGGPH